MIIDDILDNGGYDVSNPNYNPKTKKGRAEQPYLKSSNIADAHPMVNAGYDVNKHEAFMFNVADYDKYINAGISLNTWEDPKIWDKELADRQSGFTKLARGVEQAIVSELALGIPKGISDLFDAIGQGIGISDGDYTNPVSQYLEKLQNDFKEYTPIYSDPDRDTIADGGLGNMGWWAENIPSIMSSLTLLVPSAGITKGISMLGKLSKVQRATQKAVKFLTGSSAPSRMKTAGLMFKNGMTAALSRTMENYQEAQGVYQDMKKTTLDRFNEMSDEEYQQFISRNAEELEDVDTNNKEAIADAIAHKAATRTFLEDYANIGFDVIQLYALRNAWKGLRKARGSGKLDAANERIIETAGMSAEEVAAYDAAHSGVKEVGNWAKNQLIGGYKTIAAEASEGVEEAVNYIAQQEGMHLGNVMLGTEKPSAFDTRLKEYMTAPQLWDSAFWGLMGGVAFQGLGSTFNRIQNKIYEGNKKADEKTGEDKEAVKKTAWWQLDELSEIKRRKANIENQNIRLNQFMEAIHSIMGDESTQGIDIYSEDKHKFDDTEESKINQELTRQRRINEFVDDLVTEAANNGNIDYLKAYMSSDEVRQAMVKSRVISENESRPFMEEINKRIDHIEELFDAEVTQLNDVAADDDLDVPVEYLQIIANNNVQHKLNIEEYDKIKERYDEETAKIALSLKKNGKATDDQLDFYKKLVDIQVKNQELASLRGNLKKLEEDKKQAATISGQVAIDDLNTRIKAIEKQIYDDTDDITLGTSLFVSNVSERATLGEHGMLHIKNSKKAIEQLDDILAGKFDDFLKSIGSSKTSEDFDADVVRQRFAQLSEDIKRISHKKSELDNLNPNLKSLYARLSATDIARTYEQSKLTSTVDEVKHYANQLNNTMVQSRKDAIDKAYAGLVELNKKYENISIADAVNVSVDKQAFDDLTKDMTPEDKSLLLDYLQVLNLTSGSNKNLGLNIANAIRKAEILEALQQATEDEENGVTPGSTNGESSSTVQQPISSVQPDSTINQSPDQQNQPQGQGNTLNPAQQGQGQQGQGQNQNREDNVASTITALNTHDTALRDRILNDSNPEDRDTAIAELSTVYALTPEETNSVLNGIGYQPTIPSTGEEVANSPTKLSDIEVSTLLNKETTNWFRNKIQNKEEITFDEYNTAMQEVFNQAEDEAAARREAVEQYKDFAEIVSSNDEISGLVKDVISSESTLDETKTDKFSQAYEKATKTLVNRFRQDLGIKKIGGKYHISVEDLLRYCNAHANSVAPGHLIYNQIINYLQSGKLSDYVIDDISQATKAGFINQVDENLVNRINSRRDNQRVGVQYHLDRIADDKEATAATFKELESIKVGDNLTYELEDRMINVKHNGVTIGVVAVPMNDGGVQVGQLNGWTYDIGHTKGGINSKFKQAIENIITSDEQESKDIIEVLRDLGNYGLSKEDRKEIIDRLKDNKTWDKLVKDFAAENESNDVLASHLARVFDYARNFRSAFADVNRSNAIATLNQWFETVSRGFDEATYLADNPNTSIAVTEATRGEQNFSSKGPRPVNSEDTIADQYKGRLRIAMAPMKNTGEIIASRSGEVASTLSFGGVMPGSTFVVIPDLNGQPTYVQAYPARIGDNYTSLEFNNIVAEIQKVIKDSITNVINKSGDRTQAVAALQPARNLLIQLLNNWKGNTPMFIGQRIGYNPSENFVINIFDPGNKNPMYIGIDEHGDFFYQVGSNADTNKKRFNRSQVDAEKVTKAIMNRLKAKTVLNIGEDWIKSDNNTSTILGGVATRTSDGKFQIKIGNNAPHVFDSFNDFILKNNLVRVNTEVGENGDNFHRVGERGLVGNASLKYARTEKATSSPVERNIPKEHKPKYDEVSSLLNVDGNSMFDETTGKALATAVLKGHSAYKKLIDSLIENDLLPEVVRFDKTVTGNAKVNRSTGEVSVGQRWLDKIALGKDGQKQAIRKLVHERLHYLIEKNGETDNIRKQIREIYDAFVSSKPEGLDQYINWNKNPRYWDEANQTLTDEGIEEFFVESLTASDLAKYLNSTSSTKEAKASEVQNETLWQKIMKILQKLLGVNIKDNTLYAQEFMLFTEAISPDNAENIVREDIEDKEVKQSEDNETKFNTNIQLDTTRDISEDFDDDYSLLDETTGSIESLTETLPLDSQERFINLVNDGVISMMCH